MFPCPHIAPPLPHISLYMQITQFYKRDIIQQVRDGYRLEKPEHCRRELYNIMYYCWANDSQDRPTFTELVSLLDKLLLSEMDYIELELFPDHNYYNMLSLSGEKL